MLRHRTRRLVSIFIVSCTVFLFIQFSIQLNPVFIFTKTSNISSANMPIYSRLWGIPKVLNVPSSNDEDPTNLFAKEHFFNVAVKMNSVKKSVYEVLNRFSHNTDLRSRPWFMKDGQIRPKPFAVNETPILWPEQDAGDRIVQQLMYVPANYLNESNYVFSLNQNILSPFHTRKTKLKNIILYFGKKDWNDLHHGRKTFLENKCPVNTCTIARTLKNVAKSDAIIFKGKFIKPNFRRKHNQVWILYLLENPMHTESFKHAKHEINWTATYRHDSDIVTPYEKFVPYNVSSKNSFGDTESFRTRKNYAAGKTNMVAWFVSNCYATNSRLQYAYMLSNFIDVDIYGDCGVKYCPKSMNHKCVKKLDDDYKFYLAFENGNCKDYITEKFFTFGLSHNVVPIVMGASREEYSRVAPPHSYIHVDDFTSPENLAEYLKLLNGNDTLYNEYFSWKGSGEFVNTFFWCRLCALLHAPVNHKSYANIHDWWKGTGTCDVKRR